MSQVLSGGGLLLKSLKHAGVEKFFINSGTEYASLLLEYRVLPEDSRPDMVVCLTEGAAAAAAYGYYLASGKTAAVLVHTVPGVLSSLPNIFNAYSAEVPILLVSGITSFSVKGFAGSRKIRVHWGQDFRDVQAVVEHSVKWSYVVKTPSEIPEAVVRAVEIATTKPEGPVYLGVHREWLLKKQQAPPALRKPVTSHPPLPDATVVKKIAAKIVESSFPVVLTRSAGKNHQAFYLLTELAERLAMRVNYAVGDYVNISNRNVFSAKFSMDEVDFVLVVDSDVPWLPASSWREDIYRVTVGPDPLKTRMNIWGFSFDESITSDSVAFLRSLLHAINRLNVKKELLDERRSRAEQDWKNQADKNAELIESDLKRKRLTKRLASHLLGKTLPKNAVIFNEYPLHPDFLTFESPGTYFYEPPAGSLGWGFSASLGFKMAASEKFVAAVLGDGSFVFNNPASAAALSQWYRIPVLVAVFNDSCWGDVKKSIADFGVDVNEIAFLEGCDFPKPVDVASIGPGMGFRAFLIEKPEDAETVLRQAVETVGKGTPVLVDIRVIEDF
ncbi:MAG: thiamine pyrophosphate-binding protein [Candidatus Caldarchaeum sp.]|uniref:Thiamine pyrophosphate-binding protein n=1 Tax=Caldiarchaeum subterraneum TaxID=311458 RepID=A0A7C5U7Y1_CALS0